ncbi:MAG: hypothetical protein RL198_7 [Actinomycetota bacterium]|jgi:putative SOS response-associated peptidase YedK
MCGRFVLAKSELELKDYYSADGIAAELPAASYNIAPTQQIATLLVRPEGRDAAGTPLKPFHRELYSARWGLIPKWQQQPSGAPLINARIESVLQKPSFRAAAQRRVIVPASGYYEWQTVNSTKQPFFIRPKQEGALLNLAGIYEWWRSPAIDGGPNQTIWKLTVSLITTEAPLGLREIHDRAPLLIGDQWLSNWLDPRVVSTDGMLHEFNRRSAEEVKELAWYPVSKSVGSIRNNNPELIAPLAAGS